MSTSPTPPQEKLNSTQLGFIYSRFFTLVTFFLEYTLLSHYIYLKTQSASMLGFMGLAIFSANFSFTFVAGVMADKFPPLKLTYIARLSQFSVVLILLSIVTFNLPLFFYYFALFLLGVSFALDGPSANAIMADIIPPTLIKKFSSLNVLTLNISEIAGPPLGMYFYEHIYFNFSDSLPQQTQALFAPLFICALFRLTSVLLLQFIRYTPQERVSIPLNFNSFKEGIRYVYNEKIVYGAMTLDLFAVFLGGATTLLPIFASDILKVSPTMYGVLSATPAVSAATMSLIISHYGLKIHTGKRFYQSYFVFGLATLCFALSRNVYLTLLALLLLGAGEAITLIFRFSLFQERVPREVRGRVVSISSSFMSVSHHLGGFESGLTAKWFGAVPACIIGGVGTILVTAFHLVKFKELKNYGAE